MPISEKMIDQAYSDLKRVYGGDRNDYFGLLYLEKEFRLPREQAAAQVAFHGNDYGLDGFHVDRQARNLYLFQFKFSSSAQLFRASMQRLIDEGMERLFGARDQDPVQNPLIAQLKSQVFEAQALIDRVFFHFVFNGDPEEAERSQVLDRLKEDLESKRYLVEQHFKKPVPLVVEFRSALKRGRPVPVTGEHTYTLDLSGGISETGPAGEILHAGFASLMGLHAMYRGLGLRFFDRNIRGWLGGTKVGSETSVNREIMKALKTIVLDGKESPSVFAFNHNGIALSAERLVKKGDSYRITEPRLLNGAQTVSSLDRFLRQNEGNARLDERKEALASIKVLCKVITSATPEFVTNVTINNNRQNPIEPWNLHANDMIQLELQDKFHEEVQLYYERQENVFANLSDDELEESGLQPGRAVELVRLAQTFLVSDGDIYNLSHMREVFENESVYAQVFSRDRLRVDFRKIVICYKAQFRLRKLMNAILERGQNRYAYIPRARYLLWSLLCQGLLNDDRVQRGDEALETFGRDLQLSGEFTDWLEWIAAQRCRFAIKDVVDLREYSAKVAEGNFSFLRTNTAFKKAMETAHRRWRWVEKRLR